MKNPVSPIEKREDYYTQQLILPNPLGMHARPANHLVKLVKQLGASVAIETADGKLANAQKLFELLGLGLEHGAKISVISDSVDAVKTVVAAIIDGLGDDLEKNQATDKSHTAASDAWQVDGDIETIQGVGASDGLVIGRLYHYRQQHFQLPETVGSLAAEKQKLTQAIDKARDAINEMKQQAKQSGESSQQAIFDAHLSLVDDSDMLTDTLALIASGQNAAKAYKTVSDQRIQSLSLLDNVDIAARAADVRDVRNQVMNALLGKTATQHNIDRPVILCAEDLTPSDTVKLDTQHILAFVTAVGGPTSHTAIIARGIGMPAVVAAGAAIKDLPDDTLLIVDGNSGCVYINPDKAQLTAAEAAIAARKKQRQKDKAQRGVKGQTADGVEIEIAANINAADAVQNALADGAEGVGLMRTEFLYLQRESIPDEDTQEKAYREMAQALNGAPLIIRTLDIGGDKAVPYLGLAHEDNAFLGVRGIRLCLNRPDLFTPQLRAICRVAKDYPNVRVMFPMIGKLSDWRQAKMQLDEIRIAMGAPAFPVGMMIEIPSAALIAAAFADYVDFFSIGTNDLTQYTLAMDRMHPLLANQADAMHPAVLRLIAMTTAAAKAKGKWVGVCGGAAGDVDAAKVLVGLGVTELSMAPPQIAAVKAVLRQHKMQDLQALAKAALELDGCTAVRDLLKSRRNR